MRDLFGLDNIQSFNRDFDDWKPYKLKRDDTI